MPNRLDTGRPDSKPVAGEVDGLSPGGIEHQEIDLFGIGEMVMKKNL